MIALMRLTHAALGAMEPRGTGAIVNIASLAAYQPAPEQRDVRRDQGVRAQLHPRDPRGGTPDRRARHAGVPRVHAHRVPRTRRARRTDASGVRVAVGRPRWSTPRCAISIEGAPCRSPACSTRPRPRSRAWRRPGSRARRRPGRQAIGVSARRRHHRRAAAVVSRPARCRGRRRRLRVPPRRQHRRRASSTPTHRRTCSSSGSSSSSTASTSRATRSSPSLATARRALRHAVRRSASPTTCPASASWCRSRRTASSTCSPGRAAASSPIDMPVVITQPSRPRRGRRAGSASSSSTCR